MFLGIDIGTTHIKVSVFSQEGTLEVQYKEHTPITKDAFGEVYKPLEIWEIVQKLLTKVLEGYTNIKGISITGMAEAGLIMNCETGIEQSDIIPWFDQRTVDYANKITSKEEIKRFQITGLRNSYKYGIYKFLWLLDHLRIDREQAIWLSMCDYICFKLTKQFVTEPTFAARTYAYDIKTNSWDKKWLEEHDLKESNFPHVTKSGAAVGILQEENLIQLVKESPIVCIGGHDHICAAYAILKEREDGICNSIGTSETYIGVLENLHLTELRYENGVAYGPFVEEGKYFWLANIPSSGHSIEWFRKKIQKNEIEYDEMNTSLMQIGDMPTGILYYPYLTGMGTPLFNPKITASFIGLKESHSYKEVFKGIIEGISYHTKWILEKLEIQEEVAINHLICVGGATNSNKWMEIKANVLGAQIEVPIMEEVTTLGAVTLMIEKNFKEIDLRKFLKPSLQMKDKYTYNKALHEAYKKLFKERYLPILKVIIGK